MTLIVAWKDGDDAFLIGDSAVTSRVRHALDKQTSFGQEQLHDEFAVEEGAIKIWQLTSRLLVGVSGRVDGARSFIRKLREALAVGTPVDTALAELAATHRASGDERYVLVFAQSTEHQTHLIRFDSAASDESDDPVWILGSADERTRALVTERIATIAGASDPRNTPDIKLALAVASMNALNITEHLTSSFIGGAFFGARISPQGVHWQQDMTLLLYDPRLFDGRKYHVVHDEGSGIERIFICVRENSGLVFSSILSDRGRLLPPPWPARSVLEWQQVAHNAFPSRQIRFEEQRLFAFLSKVYPHVTLVVRRPNSDNPFLFVEDRIEIADEFIEDLGTMRDHSLKLRCLVDPE